LLLPTNDGVVTGELVEFLEELIHDSLAVLGWIHVSRSARVEHSV
jgi:hypothetical protein